MSFRLRSSPKSGRRVLGTNLKRSESSRPPAGLSTPFAPASSSSRTPPEHSMAITEEKLNRHDGAATRRDGHRLKGMELLGNLGSFDSTSTWKATARPYLATPAARPRRHCLEAEGLCLSFRPLAHPQGREPHKLNVADSLCGVAVSACATVTTAGAARVAAPPLSSVGDVGSFMFLLPRLSAAFQVRLSGDGVAILRRFGPDPILHCAILVRPMTASGHLNSNQRTYL
jgi:hypothetical protein